MLRLICLICLLTFTLADIVVLNDSVDQAIELYSNEIKRRERCRVPLRDVDHEFHRSRFIGLTEQLHCSGGYVEDISKFRRVGDVTWIIVGNTTTERYPLGFDNLHAHFENCVFNVKNLVHITQPVDIFVSPFSMDGQISVDRNNGECTSKLDYFKVRELGSVRIETGGNAIHRAEDHTLEWMVQKFHHEIVGEIGQALLEAAANEFKQLDFCND